MTLAFELANNLQVYNNKINLAGFCSLCKPGTIGKNINFKGIVDPSDCFIDIDIIRHHQQFANSCQRNFQVKQQGNFVDVFQVI